LFVYHNKPSRIFTYTKKHLLGVMSVNTKK
jgi:hypothetical protein